MELESWVRALAIEHQAHPVQHHHTLPLRRLYPNKAHRWPRYRFADNLGIRCIVLPALYIWLDVLGRHEAHRMPACHELTRPIMRAAASLDPDKAGRQLFEKRQDAPACKAPAEAGREGTMALVATVGLDIAKTVFEVHGVDAAAQIIIRR